MEQDDFDLEKFVDLFDTAMSSDNPTVKRAFKNLMLIVALADSENENKNGPLRNLVEHVKSLESRIAAIEWKNNFGNGVTGAAGAIGPYPYQPSPVWTTSTTWPNISGTYTMNTQSSIGPLGDTGSIATTNYTASTANYIDTTNYDILYDNLQSRN